MPAGFHWNQVSEAPRAGRLSDSPCMLLRYLQWEAKDLGFTVKELMETLEGIRVGVVSRGGTPGTKGVPEVMLESMTKRQAELVTRFRLTEMLPVLNPTIA